MSTRIAKDTLVRLQTTNGGDTIVTLLEDYRPTYSALFAPSSGGWFRVAAERIQSITVIEQAAVL